MFVDSDPSVNDITDLDGARAQLLAQLKKMLSSQNFIGTVDISRFLLVNCFWVATLIDKPEDEEL